MLFHNNFYRYNEHPQAFILSVRGERLLCNSATRLNPPPPPPSPSASVASLPVPEASFRVTLLGLDGADEPADVAGFVVARNTDSAVGVYVVTFLAILALAAAAGFAYYRLVQARLERAAMDRVENKWSTARIYLTLTAPKSIFVGILLDGFTENFSRIVTR